MRVCGVICEYDPFHNGHQHLLRRLREETGASFVLCVMSGHFTQRGHAALFSKWARAEMALRGGADAVFELPALFAVRDAERFALGGVALLDALGVVTHLGFGSECGDLAQLTRMAAEKVDAGRLRAGLDSGQTLARARGAALGYSLDAPNDVLGVEYLRAIARLGVAMTPVVIARAGAGYHDTRLGRMASATAIRAAVRRGENVFGAMPAPAYAMLRRLVQAGAMQREEGLDGPLLSLLRTADPQALASILDVSEGLEHRLLRAAQAAPGREAMLNMVKCKRYTWARLSRVSTQALLGITKALAAQTPMPTYARLLGFRRDAQALLARVAACAKVPIVTRAAKYRAGGDAAFAVDIRAGDLWSLGLENPALRMGRMDLTQGVVIVE